MIDLPEGAHEGPEPSHASGNPDQGRAERNRASGNRKPPFRRNGEKTGACHGHAAGQDESRCPHQRRKDVYRPERCGPHFHHSRRKRYDRAERTEEATGEDAERTVATKEDPAAVQKLRMAGERPSACQPVSVASAEPPRNAIPEHGAQNASGEKRKDGDRADRHKKSGGHHDRRSGKEQAQDSEGFAEGGDEHDRKRPRGMDADELHGGIDQFHHLVMLALAGTAFYAILRFGHDATRREVRPSILISPCRTDPPAFWWRANTARGPSTCYFPLPISRK